jgi:hypothetical protein
MSKVKEQEMKQLGVVTSHDNARISSVDTAVVTPPSFSPGRLLDGVILAHLPHKIFECVTHVPIPLCGCFIHWDLPTRRKLFNMGA